MEKEKVVRALETCIGCRPCKDCPFDRTVAGITNFPSCMVELQKEALSLIKELIVQSESIPEEKFTLISDGNGGLLKIKETESVCPICNGKGFVQGNFYDVPGANVSFGGYIENGRKTEICRNCNGKGTIIKGG